MKIAGINTSLSIFILAEGATEKSAKHNVASVALSQLKLTPTNALDSKIELDPTSSPFVPGEYLF